MEKISQSEQLRSVTDPEIFILFEDWLEKLENEAVTVIMLGGPTAPEDLSRGLGLSESGSMFLITKLKRDGKI